MTLTKEHLQILRTASDRGSFRPSSKAQVDRCLKLCGAGYLEENDNAPGVYEITREGETALEDALEDVA